MTAQPPLGLGRLDIPARVPGALQQPPAGRTGYVPRWVVVERCERCGGLRVQHRPCAHCEVPDGG